MPQMLVKNYYENKQNFSNASFYDVFMNEDAKTFARNLKLLMDYYGDTQEILAKKCTDITQKTISNMLNPGDNRAPNLEKCGQVAKRYGLQTWHLLIPNATIETLVNSSIEKLVDTFIVIDHDSRDTLMRVAENSARYTSALPEAKIKNTG